MSTCTSATCPHATSIVKNDVTNILNPSLTPPVVIDNDFNLSLTCRAELIKHHKELAILIEATRFLDCNLDHFDTPTPARSLIDQISPPSYDTPAASLNSIRIRRSKIMKKEKEARNMILAINKRLGLIGKEVSHQGMKDNYLMDYGALCIHFNQFKSEFPERVDRYTNKQWCHILRDLKAIRRIPFANLESNWDLVCAEFAALGKQKSFVYT